MPNRTTLAAMLTGGIWLLGSSAALADVVPASAVAPECDRSCLTRVMDGYLAALVRHDATGLPIGVMRSEKQYENFILHIEWRHMKEGGNSGVFVWSEGTPPPSGPLPKGMEVQMLELEWPNLNPKDDGTPNHPGYVSGELFGANGLTATPDFPRGERSMSTCGISRESGIVPPTS